jgi:hypothetical protein
MAPSKKNKGKQPIGESSQADEIREETVDMQPSKAKKFKSEVGRRELMKIKYVKPFLNLRSFCKILVLKIWSLR